MTGAAPRIRIPALRAVAACVALLIMDGRPASASCPASCASPATWTQPFAFAGLTWQRKSGCGGPGPNCWAPGNVTVVPGEGIRLRLTRVQGRWYAAEIRTDGPVACGAYSFHLVGRTDLLDPNVVLGVFLYDDAAGDTGDPCPDELDLESSRFGDPNAPNGHFVSYTSGTCGPSDLGDFSYALTGTHTTHQLDWAPGAATFRLMHGHRVTPDLPEHVIGERSFVSPQVPAAGGMRLHVNLWAFAGNAPTDQKEVEIVIRDVVATAPVLAAASTPAAGPELSVRQNPAHGVVDIRFALPAAEHARLSILDIAGRRLAQLADASFATGPHALRWAPGAAPPGVYFARLEAGGRTITRRIVLLR